MKRFYLNMDGGVAATASLIENWIDKTEAGMFAEETGIVRTMIQAASQAKIEVNRLRRNIAVLTGKDGKLLIDAGFTVSRPRISPALDSLSADPITRLINTHWHVDHTDGNAWLPAEGATIDLDSRRRLELYVSTCAGKGAPHGDLR